MSTHVRARPGRGWSPKFSSTHMMMEAAKMMVPARLR